MDRIKSYIIVFVLLPFIYSCSADYNKEELGKVKKGMTKSELISKVGIPIKEYDEQRWIYNDNVYLNVFKGKVANYFISGEELKKAKKDVVSLNKVGVDKAYEDVRIGMTKEDVYDMIGTPKVVDYIDVIYYEDYQKIIIHNGVVESVNLHLYQDLSILDKIRLNTSGGGMFVINIALAIIMFGVALEINLEQFKEIYKHPKSILVGILSQFIVLPALTYLLILLIKPTASVALGMILVAASPGGNISNFMTSMSKGNSALSISLTAFATLVAVFMTPFNFSFWGNLYSETSNMIIPIQIDFYQMIKTVLMLLGVPVILGLGFKYMFEDLAAKISKPLKIFSLIFFGGLIVGAMSLNFEFIVKYLYLVALIVMAHNLVALFTGYYLGVIFKLPKIDRRTLSIETGIQNSGLALVLIFNPKLFDGLGGMAFIAAWWGIWHIISGIVISLVWSRR